MKGCVERGRGGDKRRLQRSIAKTSQLFDPIFRGMARSVRSQLSSISECVKDEYTLLHKLEAVAFFGMNDFLRNPFASIRAYFVFHENNMLEKKDYHRLSVIVSSIKRFKALSLRYEW